MFPSKQDVEKELETICRFYEMEKELLQSERKIVAGLKDKDSKIFTSTWSLIEWIENDGIADLLPSYSKLAFILGTIPATSCSPERSFSALRRIKTYLRSTMGQERLLDISILNIERETTNFVLKNSMEKMIDTFANRKNCAHLLLH